VLLQVSQVVGRGFASLFNSYSGLPSSLEVRHHSAAFCLLYLLSALGTHEWLGCIRFSHVHFLLACALSGACCSNCAAVPAHAPLQRFRQLLFRQLQWLTLDMYATASSFHPALSSCCRFAALLMLLALLLLLALLITGAAQHPGDSSGPAGHRSHPCSAQLGACAGARHQPQSQLLLRYQEPQLRGFSGRVGPVA
jgi:hypothetical protein